MSDRGVRLPRPERSRRQPDLTAGARDSRGVRLQPDLRADARDSRGVRLQPDLRADARDSRGVRLQPDLRADARSIIADALATAGRPCITSSFQAECVVLTHMLREVRPDIPVLFLDTFHHFPQTLAYRDEMTGRWGLNLVNLRAEEPRVGLWQAESTEACCARHKVGPLFTALEGYDAWFTALRRDQAASRANLQEIEPFKLPSGRSIRRVAPMAAWTARDVWKYAADHDIPLLPLYDLGYTSIGCEPCTSLPVDPDNPRSGRWQGQKLECGIHIQVK